MNNINREELCRIFQSIKSENKDAVNELYEKYKNLVTNISFSIVKDKYISEEICQSVFLKIIKLPKEQLPMNNELSWLYTVTKNETIEYIRKQKNTVDIDELYEIEDENNEIAETIDIESFNQLIDGLSNIEKEIVTLKIISNFTFKEIGQILNMPTATVQWRYYKAIHTLKILISNFTMFTITFLIYLFAKETQTKEKWQTEEHIAKPNEHDKISETIISAIDSSDEHLRTNQSINKSTCRGWLLGLSSIFLTTTIIFGIIFIKFQQKRKKKRLNNRGRIK